MATESTHVSAVVPASSQIVYEAWLSSEQHAKMTGGAATIDPAIGGSHSAWGGYISGKTLELDPGKRIVQSWRTQEFLEEHGDSKVLVLFEGEGGHTRVTIVHTDIPEGQAKKYETGWIEHYVDPMLAHFSASAAPAVKRAPVTKSSAKTASAKKPAAKKPAAKKSAAKKSPAKKSPAKKSTKRSAKRPVKGTAKK